MKRLFFFLLTLVILASSLLTSCSSGAQLESNLTPSETAQQSPDASNATKETEPIVTTKPEQKDPSTDYFLNVLIIGNSFSTGWPDELNGLLSAAGIKANIYTVYYSGCPLSHHWTWLQNGQAYYRLRHHRQEGGISDDKPVNLKFCLKQKNWDVISLQQHFGPSNALSYDDMMKSCTPFAANLFNYQITSSDLLYYICSKILIKYFY